MAFCMSVTVSIVQTPSRFYLPDRACHRSCGLQGRDGVVRVASLDSPVAVGPIALTLAVLCFSEALGGGHSLVSLLGVSWFVRWSLSSPACWWFCWLLRGDCPGCLLQYRPHCVPALWGRWPDGLGVRIRLLRCQGAWVRAYSSHVNLSCQPLFRA